MNHLANWRGSTQTPRCEEAAYRCALDLRRECVDEGFLLGDAFGHWRLERMLDRLLAAGSVQ